MSVDLLPLLVDRDEAARCLRCSPAVLDRLIAAGRLTPVFLDAEDAEPKFRPEDIVDLVETASARSAPTGPRHPSVVTP